MSEKIIIGINNIEKERCNAIFADSIFKNREK